MTPAAERSWSTFGEATLNDDGEGLGGYFAFRAADGALRWLSEASDAGWSRGITVEESHTLRAVAKQALVSNLMRVLRWGGGSTCNVLAHSVRVGAIANLVSRRLSGSEAEQRACSSLGAIHDLHEGLPGIGDVPSPALRWLMSEVPAIRDLHARAEALVLRVCEADVDLESPGRARQIVKWADRFAASAIERGGYFNDAPPWLGDACGIAVHAARRAERIRFVDAMMQPRDLLAMLADGAPPIGIVVDAADDMRALTRSLLGDIESTDLARMVLGESAPSK